MGGDAERLAATLRSQRVLLAAHGPYTAAGVAEILRVPVGCVSKDFSSFDGEPLVVRCGAYPAPLALDMTRSALNMVQPQIGARHHHTQRIGVLHASFQSSAAMCVCCAAPPPPAGLPSSRLQCELCCPQAASAADAEYNVTLAACRSRRCTVGALPVMRGPPLICRWCTGRYVGAGASLATDAESHGPCPYTAGQIQGESSIWWCERQRNWH
jgi:hypothetical protein